MKGRGGCVRSFGHEHDICQAEKAENTDPCSKHAVNYATARGHLETVLSETVFGPFPPEIRCYNVIPVVR